MLVRPATHADLPDLCELARTFVSESDHPYTYDAGLSEQAFRSYLDNPLGACVVAENRELDGKAIQGTKSRFLQGWWSAFICCEYVVEAQCYVNKFYVAPWGRGTGAARLLMESLVQWADDNACVDTWVTATAGIGRDKAFIGLCERYGFETGGLALVRR